MSENLEKMIDKAEKKLAKAEPGSEEAVAIMQELEVYYELKKNSEALDIEKRKLDLEESRAEEDRKLVNKIPWGAVVGTVGTGLITIGVMCFEGSGNLFKAPNLPKLIK